MFTNLGVRDFKSISMSTPIDLKGLTILCGSNSSGKSSLIQVLLLLSQSFSNRYPDGPITLNGNLLRLGAFSDIKSKFSKKGGITFSFTLDIVDSMFGSENASFAEYEFEFGRTGNLHFRREEDYHPVLLRNKIKIYKKTEDNVVHLTDAVTIELDKLNKNGETKYIITEFESIESSRFDEDYPECKFISEITGNIVPTSFLIEYNYTKKISSLVFNIITRTPLSRGQSYEVSSINENYFIIPLDFVNKITSLIIEERQKVFDSIIIPENFIKTYKKINEKENEKSFKTSISKLKEDVVRSNFILDKNTIPESLKKSNGIQIGTWNEFVTGLDTKVKTSLLDFIIKHRNILQEVWYSCAPNEIKRATVSIQSLIEADSNLNLYFSRSLKYLGPLRLEPQAIYSALGQNDPNSVGLKGEFTAAVLHRNKNLLVDYYSPEITNGELNFITKRGKLRTACQEWLSYLGVIRDVNTDDKGKYGYELKVKTDSTLGWHDLTHVGVGVSQVLPIVLMFLLSDYGDILIFEQPELHLHPQVQSRLCDLFIAMSESGRQCVIETHSEYLINRLRLRIAQENSQSIIDNSALYFVTKHEGRSSFDRIEINRFGSVIDWPSDFFDQTDREIERILFEADAKRKKENGFKRNIRFEVKDVGDN